MSRAIKTIVYDEELRIEAYCFKGMRQPFPSHFHEYYVIGCVETGARRLRCGNQLTALHAGDTVLFNPGDSHGCEQSDGGDWDYRGFSIAREVMLDWTEEISGRRELPKFSPNVIHDEEAAVVLRTLHDRVLAKDRDFGKEESLLLLISTLIQKYGEFKEEGKAEENGEIEHACAFMEQNFARRMTLDEIARCAGMSKATLIRAFSRMKGVTPYQYLENVRIGKARKLLEEGMTSVDVALTTGFSDQSHFTNVFGRYIGLTPGVYREIFSGTRRKI